MDDISTFNSNIFIGVNLVNNIQISDNILLYKPKIFYEIYKCIYKPDYLEQQIKEKRYT